MKKELGYLLVGVTLMTGAMIAPDVGNALTIKNETGAVIGLDLKEKQPVDLPVGEVYTTEDLSVLPVTVVEKNMSGVVNTFVTISANDKFKIVMRDKKLIAEPL
ncbi:MAG: hypothetical protein H0X26_01290 [Alphaproteobacteria bacterium]|nr:hypothetical protein [Alphaproteobacteria bacterium]